MDVYSHLIRPIYAFMVSVGIESPIGSFQPKLDPIFFTNQYFYKILKRKKVSDFKQKLEAMRGDSMLLGGGNGPQLARQQSQLITVQNDLPGKKQLPLFYDTSSISKP